MRKINSVYSVNNDNMNMMCSCMCMKANTDFCLGPNPINN